MKFTILLGLLFCFSITLVSGQQKAEPATSAPDRIMLSIPGDPASTRAVTWRTSSEIKSTIGQITEASSSPFFNDRLNEVKGYSRLWKQGDSTALGHQIIFKDLRPETNYIYRVGDGTNWSEWFQFKTSSAQNKAFSFLYLGDFQNDIKQYCSRLIRQAYSHFPHSDFILFAGDLVSRSTEEYWQEFFYAGNWIYGTIPSVPTPGNHEYDKNGDNAPRTFSKHWNQIFVTPPNHPEGLKGRTYYMDYQNVRFVSIDSPAMGNNEDDRNNTLSWLNTVLSDNPNKWTILFTHYPVYSCSQGRDSEAYRKLLKPLLEQYGVDLVLQGHDHTYCRGQNLKDVGPDCTNPPMYMVSVSGPKMYGLNANKWSDRVASETQLYQNISIKDNKLKVDVYTILGQKYDSFTIVKNNRGKNKVIESKEVITLKEHIAIPETAKHRYTEEDLRMYQKNFK